MKQWICVLCCMALLCAMVGCAVEETGLLSSESEFGIDKEASQSLGMGESSGHLLAEEGLEGVFGSGDSSSDRSDDSREKRLGFVEVKRFLNGKGLQDLSCKELQEFEAFLESVGYRDFFQATQDVFSGSDSFHDGLLKDGRYVVELTELDFGSLREAAELQNWYLRLLTLS